MTGYKQIIGNMVDMGVCDFIEGRTGKNVYAYPINGTLKLSTEDKTLGHPTFEIEVKVDYRTFKVCGYITDYGKIVVCSVEFERDKIIDNSRTDWHAKDNIKHVHEFLWGEKLDNFAFDR